MKKKFNLIFGIFFAFTCLIMLASCGKKGYQLNFIASIGGSIEGEVSQSVNKGEDATTVTAKPDAGYVFVQWSDGSVAATRTEVGVEADKTVCAIFERAFTVTFEAAEHGKIGVQQTVSQVVCFQKNTTAVEAVADEGYVFVKWSDGDTNPVKTVYGVTSNKTLTATFALKPAETPTETPTETPAENPQA